MPSMNQMHYYIKYMLDVDAWVETQHPIHQDIEPHAATSKTPSTKAWLFFTSARK